MGGSIRHSDFIGLMLRRAPPSRALTLAARLTGLAFLVALLLLAIVPWQQTAFGKGRVIAYAPIERQQNIEAPIEGRILRWYVQEGSRVKEGDPVADITDNDPDILQRIRTERDAIAGRIESTRQRAISVEGRVDALTDSRRSAIMAAKDRVRMADQRVLAADHGVDAAKAADETAKLNLERQRALFDKGLSSKRTLELAELDIARTRTDLDRAKAALLAAKSEQSALKAEQQRIDTDAQAAIQDASAAMATAEAEVGSASAELARIEGRLARQSTQAVKAGRAGIIFRVVSNAQGGELVKAGDILAILVPDTNDRAVELLLDGNDMPLVSAGNKVRVQFEGWPAVQFSGWPSVAIGTFGGVVALVDSTDDGKGKFRVLILPDKDDEAWPSTAYLRQGVRAQGWALLGTVKLGYELWRQFNGFPPSLATPPETQEQNTKK